MKAMQIDVELEVPADEYQISDKDFARQAMERMRDTAARHAADAGGRLRTDRLPEFASTRAVRPGLAFNLAEDVLVMRSRWWVDVPDTFDPATGSAIET